MGNTDGKTSPNHQDNAVHTDSISVATSTPRSNSQIDARRQIDDKLKIETSPLPHRTSDIDNPPLTKLKVRTEASAMVLAFIVILFIITHSFRIALKVSELASPNVHTIEKFKACFTLKR